MSGIPVTISHYEIEEELGRGGMGIVYRARDSRLGRTVALKVLPARALDSDLERERFYREARNAAALSHPNIATVYEIDEAADASGAAAPFIAMEYIEGESLSDEIARAPLPIDRAARIGAQIAHALDEAHRNGIVHRDIKGANIIVKGDGTAKVLDFGIARSTSATTITEDGTTLGTIAYMSPEQTRGEAVDGRTDIWSLGVLLYEMVAGRKPFQGSYDQAIMYSILNEDPEPLTAIRTGVPMEMEIVVSKALEKDRKDRYQHASELKIDLDRLARGKSRTVIVPETRERKRVSPRPTLKGALPWVVAVLACAIVVFVLTREPPESPPESQRFTIATDTLVLGSHPVASVVSISPDGSRIVYSAVRQGVQQLFIREVGSYLANPIPGTLDASGAFFSPDGQWLGFAADGVLKKISTSGGVPVTLCAADEFHSGSWSRTGEIFFSASSKSGDLIIQSVASSGGTPKFITAVDLVDEWFHVYPEIIPGRREILFVSLDGTGGGPKLWVLSLDTGERRFLVEGGNPRFLSSGHLLYPRNGSLWAVRLDPETMDVLGEPVGVAEGLMMGFLYEPAIAHYAVSETGTLVYLPGEAGREPENAVVLVGENAEEEIVLKAPRPLGGVRMSPEQTRVAFRMPDNLEIMQVWVYDIRRDTFTQLTSGGQNWWPVWTPDGLDILNPWLTPANDTDIFAIRADGSREARLVVGTPNRVEIPYSFSSDGSHLFYQKQEWGDTGWDLWTMAIDDSTSARPILATLANEFNPAISPDGEWLAYASSGVTEGYGSEVFVMEYPGMSRRWQISNSGGVSPMWSLDGKRLFYEERAMLDGKGQILSVAWETEPTVQPGRAEIAFAGEFEPNLVYGRNIDVAADGRLLVVQNEQPAPQLRLNIVVDWFSELERRVP